MSTAKNLLRQSIEMGHMVTRAYVEDLTDAELLVRSVPGSNHVAWQLGHMIGSVRGMLAGLGRPAPALPNGFEAAYTRETSASDDPAKFATKAEYLALMGQMKAASLAAVEATPEVASVAGTETPTVEVYQPSSPSVPVRTGVPITGGGESIETVRRMSITFPAWSMTRPCTV